MVQTQEKFLSEIVDAERSMRDARMSIMGAYMTLRPADDWSDPMELAPDTMRKIVAQLETMQQAVSRIADDAAFGCCVWSGGGSRFMGAERASGTSLRPIPPRAKSA